MILFPPVFVVYYLICFLSLRSISHITRPAPSTSTSPNWSAKSVRFVLVTAAGRLD